MRLIALLVKFVTADTAGRRAIADGFTGRWHAGSAQQYRQMRSSLASAQEARLFWLIEKHDKLDEAQIVAVAETILREAGAEQLPRAMATGLVDIQPIGTGADLSPAVVGIILDEIAELLKSYVSAEDTTFPLFDDGAGNMLRSMLASGKVVDPKRSHAQEAGIAGTVIGGLEAFPNADLDVVLDVREQLREPLMRFRSALSRVAGEFGSAAWEAGFPSEVEDYYRREIEPALLDVRECLDQLRVRPTLLRMTASKNVLATAAATGAATLGLAAFAGAHVELPHLLYGAAGVAGLGSGAASEVRERLRVRTTAAHNPFYFLYQANEELHK